MFSERELITKIERLETCISLAMEVAYEWRQDWSDFDGRTLLSQMEDLGRVAAGQLSGAEYREDWGLPR